MSVWKLRTRELDVSRGVIMGVINATPDSFSDGGLHLDDAAAVAAGRAMIDQGADLVDIGGESTRPGAEEVPAIEELRRVIPVVEALAAAGAVVSIDTSKPEVARAALDAGAEIVNDVTAASTPGMTDVLGETGAGVVLMHMKGTPRTMQREPTYDDVVGEVATFLDAKAQLVIDAGVAPAAVAIDPGIGFGKTVTHNLELIDGLALLAEMGFPLVLGTSRKAFLGRVARIEDPARRDGVTAVTTALGFERGARVFRVHNVVSSRAALSLAAAIVSPQQWDEWSQD
ncbi:MAG TPA: dihydropteroate synthase [Acidimicrobiia bacterium]|nr:dihydropteroate synthase [Acidimicrobiia bacterium]